MQEEQYWEAVQTRDTSADGTFVYAVRSTGIYCNPSCPSRRPKRQQVVFFAQPQAAEEAGFRACRRCYPDEISLQETQVAVVQQACSYIETHLHEALTLEALGEQVHMSAFHLQRVFKRVMGITPRQYVEACRLGQLKEQLREGDAVTKALYDVGYSSSSRLYERTQAQLGMTPMAYRRGGKDMSITYTIVNCPLGRLLVGATEKGICAVSLGNADTELETALAREYPAAERRRENSVDGEMSGDSDLAAWVNMLLEHLNGQQPHLRLPVDVQATAFQWRVWSELQNIPYGSTRSYSEVARAVGSPKAARAVAQACATNPVAIVIPCHRVVREDGDLGGYRWGLNRKERLLEQEQKVPVV